MQPSPFNCKPPAPQPLADHKNRNRLHRILNGCPTGPRIMANSSRPYSSTSTANTASKRAGAGRHRKSKSIQATDAHEKALPVDQKIIDGQDDMPRNKLQHTVSSDTTLSSGVDDSPEASTVNLNLKPQPPQTNGDDTTKQAAEKPAVNGFHAHDAVSDEPYPELEGSRRGDAHENSAWRAGGVRFAPLRIPLRRRLQTAAVLWHCMGIATFLAIFWFTCANPLMWPLLVPYLIYMSVSSAPVDGKLARRSERLRSLKLWKWFADYFPMRLHKTHDLDPNRRYIMGYHPHGIISHGAWSAFATNALGFREKFPGITNSLLTLDSNFRIPLHRDWILAMGVSSVSKESIRNLLSIGGKDNDGKGRAVTIVIGGARESLEAEPGHLRLVLKNRKGFVKMALRSGADLVPVMGFGENDIYDQLNAKTHPGVHRFQMFCLKVFKFTLPAMHGRGLLNYDVGLMPYRRPVNIVVGRPIRIDTQPGHQPTTEEVDRYHELYVRELEKLWESYKDQFCPGRISELEFKD